MTTLATMLADIRLKLDDVSADRYSDNAITEAIEMALSQYSKRKPLLKTYNVDSTNSKRIVLPADFIAMAIVGVEWVTDLADFTDGIAFYATLQDEQWVLETPGNLIPAGETLNIIYHASHTIDGLNSGAGTTVPASDDDLLEHGAAGYAALAHATSLVETNNLNPMEAKDLMLRAQAQIEYFLSSIGSVESIFAHASLNDKSIDRNY